MALCVSAKDYTVTGGDAFLNFQSLTGGIGTSAAAEPLPPAYNHQQQTSLSLPLAFSLVSILSVDCCTLEEKQKIIWIAHHLSTTLRRWYVSHSLLYLTLQLIRHWIQTLNLKPRKKMGLTEMTSLG
ncbi:hypothetical protein L6164_029137 [Bauhinia variegata]|uniref:Uncharacterized protein n=1 Tax=Bauhinia variegata TaxID=167791 RepID=A0ACB9L7V5_BAUVA|nr:hypothetical protein L6164_029137 [Bauhinia variegata]